MRSDAPGRTTLPAGVHSSSLCMTCSSGSEMKKIYFRHTQV